MLARETFSIVRTCGTIGVHSCWMLKKAGLLSRPPRRAKTRRSPGKTAASEEARRTLRYVEPQRSENAAGGLFQYPARIFSCLLRAEETEDSSVAQQWPEPARSRQGLIPAIS